MSRHVVCPQSSPHSGIAHGTRFHTVILIFHYNEFHTWYFHGLGFRVKEFIS